MTRFKNELEKEIRKQDRIHYFSLGAVAVLILDLIIGAILYFTF